MKMLFICITCALMLGCLATPKRAIYSYRNTEYIESEYAPYKLQGDASIAGQAFMKTKGGDVKYGAGETVYLMPKTSYSTEINIRTFQQKIPLLPELDKRHAQTVKNTIADGEGRFQFINLPAGSYFVACDVFWMVPSVYSSSLERTGGVAIAEVNIISGEHLDIVATQPGRVFGQLPEGNLPKLEETNLSEADEPVAEDETSCSGKITSLDNLCFRDGLWYEQDSISPYKGKALEYWPNGKPKSEIEYRNGVWHGKFIDWYESGQKKKEGKCRAGVIIRQICWHEQNYLIDCSLLE